MRRREFIALFDGATAVTSRPLPAFVQTSSKRPLIAAQLGGSKTETDRFFGDFPKECVSLATSKAKIMGLRSATATAM
jgi:hypothetical protein